VGRFPPHGNLAGRLFRTANAPPFCALASTDHLQWSNALPLSHAKLASFYLQIGQQLGAGLTLAQALGDRSAAPADDCAQLVRRIEAGEPVGAIFNAAGDWLPADDRPFLIAAAETGRLPRILQNLATRHEELGIQQARMVQACLYPVGVLHFGALVFAYFRLLNWETGLHWSTPGFIAGVLMIILPFWSGVVLLGVLVRRRNPVALGLLNVLPAIGAYRRQQALADFAFALGHLLEAGAPIGIAWSKAGTIANSPRIAAAAATICAAIDRGAAPSTLLNAQPVFPAAFVSMYRTGEITGNLDQNLLHLAATHREHAQKQLKLAASIYPSVLFFAVAGLVLYIVISAYSGYIGNLNRLMEGM
jgi:general secretion pathway protein F/type IV pilus assembly protein PilC